ncbi:MAG: MFS transporter [Planctomycetes bacterium]|nr:MFS transporter [Planctomycetota bacterium]
MPFGFQAMALPVLLRERGVSLSAIGYASALALPWMLKALWAPLVDRYGSARFGRRRSWIVPMLALMGGLLGATAAGYAYAEVSLQSLLLVVFLSNLFAATQDIAVDGLAVELLEREELGLGNVAQYAGYRLGMLTSGGLLLAFSESLGWSNYFKVLATLTALVLLLFLLLLPREPEPSAEQGAARETFRALLRTVWRTVGTAQGAWVLVFLATYRVGETLIDGMFKPFLVDQGFTREQLGWWLGTYGSLAAVVGSLLGGLLATKLSVHRALSAILVARLLPLAASWAIATPSVWGGAPGAEAVIGITCLENAVGAALSTVLFAFMMGAVDKRIGATHYTLLASVEVFGKSPGYFFCGVIADGWGIPATFFLGVLLSAWVLVLWRAQRLRWQAPLAAAAVICGWWVGARVAGAAPAPPDGPAAVSSGTAAAPASAGEPR